MAHVNSPNPHKTAESSPAPPEVCSPQFWVERMERAEALLMDTSTIEAFNKKIRTEAPSISPAEDYPNDLPRREVVEEIQALSSPPDSARYDASGRSIDPEYWHRLHAELALDAIPERQPVRLGLTVRRAPMRTFPTDDAIFKTPQQRDIDRFMETTAYPCEPLAVLWTSRNREWHFAQMVNYRAWIRAENVAIVNSRSEWMRFVAPTRFLVVCGPKIAVSIEHADSGTSELAVDMGARLPLADERETPQEPNDRGTTGNHLVLLPTRSRDDEGLNATIALAPHTADAHVGYLPYTRANIVRQAFKCLGEPYGWGGMFDARDCSSLVTDVFNCFGIRLPRNAGQQANLRTGRTLALPAELNARGREDLLDGIPSGATLYLPGHVMIYLGKHLGRHWAIHDAYEYFLPGRIQGASPRRVSAKRVVVTDLDILREDGRSFLESLYAIQDFLFPDS